MVCLIGNLMVTTDLAMSCHSERAGSITAAWRVLPNMTVRTRSNIVLEVEG